MIGNVCIMHNISLKLRLLGVGHVVIRLLPQAQEKKFEKFFIAKNTNRVKSRAQGADWVQKKYNKKKRGHLANLHELAKTVWRSNI